ncbi:hypothetical protein [Mucilaginibacter sp.]
MLSNISWGDFITYVAIATVLYYITIGFLYYRPEIKSLLAGKPKGFGFTVAKGKESGKPVQDVKIPQNQTTIIEGKNYNLPDNNDLNNILNEIRYEIIPKAGSHPTKAKLATVFQYYLETLNGNLPVPFKNDINQLIVKIAIEQCGISFTEEEVQQLW